ncbi:hypothetical protein DRO66_00830 [Candidatus Bathyarchaeota archaeon]|nr:MAG: hypothetical protein DRO66_00830 [Candidatus Bathyarchaeota archaeon]
MKIKLHLGLILLIGIIAISNIQFVRAAGDSFQLIDVYWGDNQQTEASPGNIETLTVVLRYELDYVFNSLIADLQFPDGFEAVGGGETVTIQYTGPISSGFVISLEFPVYLSEDLDLGSYTAFLELEYKRSRYVSSIDSLEIIFEVTGKPVLRVSSQEDNVYEGKQTIWIEFNNTGDATAHNIEIGDAVASGVSAEFVISSSLGDLEPGNSVLAPLEIVVPSGTRGNIIPITIDVSYFGLSNVLYSSTEKIQLLVKSTPIIPLSPKLTPNELTIGEHNQINITLTNAGNHTLSNIGFTLSPDNNLKILSDQTIFHYVSISPLGSIQMSLEIYVPSNTLSPTASINLYATYFDEEVWLEQSESYALNFLLRGLIDISLTDQVVIPSETRIGSPFSATVTITNIGTSTAYAASASPELENLPVKTFGPKSVYIGDIKLNLPTTFTINLQLENTTENEIIIPVTLTYMDNLRKTYETIFNIPVSISHETNPSPGTPQGSPTPPFRGALLIGGSVVIVAVVIIMLRRRKRNRGE